MHLRQLDLKLDSKCFLVIKDIHLKLVFTELMNQKKGPSYYHNNCMVGNRNPVILSLKFLVLRGDHAKELIKFNST